MDRRIDYIIANLLDQKHNLLPQLLNYKRKFFNSKSIILGILM